MFLLKSWREDAQASLVVSLVALPLCLGIALASGAPLLSGLIAGIIGGLIVGPLSGSNISVSGPAAGLTVIVVNSISELGSYSTFAMALVLSGLLQIVFGAFKAGKIGNYFPNSVIKGMLAAIGIILILKQIPHALGYDAVYMGDESFFDAGGLNTFTRLILTMNWFHPGALIVAVFCLFIILFWENRSRKLAFLDFLPGPLIAVVFSILLNFLFKKFVPELEITQTHLVQLPLGSELTQHFYTPEWAMLIDLKVWTIAFTIDVISSLESLLSLEAADKINTSGAVASKNRELVAQGFGNTLSGLIGGLPVTAVIVRTSANANAGAKTKLSAILHGFWLLCFVLFIPTILNLIPLASLAAVLLIVGYKLTKIELYKDMIKRGKDQFIPFIGTVIAILFTDLLTGITIGMIVGFIFVLKSNVHKSIVVVQDKNDFLIRFYKDVSFLQKLQLLTIFQSIPEGAQVILDGSKGVYVDADIEDTVRDFIKRSHQSGITVQLKKSSLSLSNLFREEHSE